MKQGFLPQHVPWPMVLTHDEREGSPYQGGGFLSCKSIGLGLAKGKKSSPKRGVEPSFSTSSQLRLSSYFKSLCAHIGQA